MWDHVPAPSDQHLSHDPACLDCGHPKHTYLPCSDTCGCRPRPTPGTGGLLAA